MSRNAPTTISRRDLLWRAGGGALGIALAQLTAEGATHHEPKAKRLLLIFLPGGISHVDTFDYKPELVKHHGKETQGANTITPFFGKRGTVMKSPWEFRRRGQSGKWVSELVPHVGERVDDLTFLHSMVSRSNSHGPAMFQMATGFLFQGFPSVGSWISYGLGAANANLPAYVVLPDPHGMPPGGVAQWSNGFLPAAHQGVIFGDYKQPIADLFPPPSVTPHVQTASYSLLTALNEEHLNANPGEDALVARIKSYELAARMQLSAPEVTDLSRETQATLNAYGVTNPANDAGMTAYASNCLLARRLLEKGVRCIQLYNGAHFGKPRRNWDAHEDLVGNHGKLARVMDQPTAALLADLKQRGLLDETLVVWTTEFGRLPISEGLGEGGRDHNPEGFTSFLAGPGLRSGFSYGSTDEMGYKAAENPVTTYDLHATVLHLLGLDHTRLTYYHNGLQRRLTDVHGHVIRGILS